jgi:RNA polymerase sigma factor (sigma-70 family)
MEPPGDERCRRHVEDTARESHLVARARGGDDAAYGELVRMHEEIAFRAAFLVLGHAAEAEDAAQEAFLKAHRSLSRFRPEAPFRPWLVKIVANTARNRRRSSRRRAGAQLRLQARDGMDATEPSAESVAMAADRRRRLFEAVNALSPEDRLVISGRYFLDLAEGELAALAGVARGTVKSRLSRARKRLSDRLGRDAGGWTDD